MARRWFANLQRVSRPTIQKHYFLLIVVLACSSTPAFGLDSQKNIDQYGHDTWTSQNGLPGEAVYQILQSQDGYLWLRTSAGLVRFDGVRFVLVDPIVENHAVDQPVRAICIGTDDDLLIRTTSRTLIYKRGAFADYRPAAPLPDGEIRNIFESKEHEVFIGSDDFLYVIQGGDLKMLRRGTGWINGFLDSSGKIWIGSGGASPLAEDNPVNQRVASRLLEKRGHRVQVVADGREALKALEKETFDLIFMDVQMPEMDGFEATAAIRRKEQGGKFRQPIIALTAHAMKGDRERCMAAGMDGYLSKPIRAQELDEILQRYVVRPAGTANPADSVEPAVRS